MRGASVVRRRSVTNPGDTARSVNGGQADGGGSGLLAGGNADGSAGTRQDAGQQDPPAAAGGQAGQAAQGTATQAAPAAQPGAALAPVALPADPRGTGSSARSATVRSRRPGSGQSRYALANWRVRYRLAAVIAVPTLIASALGAFLIYGDVNNWVASGRIQHLAQLNASVVKLTQALEDERDLSGAYTADRGGNAGLIDPLKQAQDATNADAQTVANEAGVVTTGAGYDPATVQEPGHTGRQLQRPAAPPPARVRIRAPRKGSSGSSICRTCYGPPSRSSRRTRVTSSTPRTRSAPRPAPAPTTATCRPTSLPWPRCCWSRTRCRSSGPSCSRR